MSVLVIYFDGTPVENTTICSVVEENKLSEEEKDDYYAEREPQLQIVPVETY